MRCDEDDNYVEVGQDVIYDSQLDLLPIQEKIENPDIPYIGVIPVVLEPGRQIVINGVMTPTRDCFRFSIDLSVGPYETDDIVFHLNPRLDHQYVARNSRLKGQWGQEEAAVSQRSPFKRNDKFCLVIFTAEEQFLIAVNGSHFCSYTYRAALRLIKYIHVRGAVKIDLIHHCKANVYPESSLERLALYRTINNTRRTIGSELLEQGTPFIGILGEPFQIGKEIEVYGRAKLLPDFFYINLQQGQQNWPHPIILLHLKPQFLVTSDTVTEVVYNSWLEGGWGTEEKSQRSPFHPGTCFILNIKCEEDHFVITVNGKHLADFKHRASPELVDTICLDGDVVIKDIMMTWI